MGTASEQGWDGEGPPRHLPVAGHRGCSSRGPETSRTQGLGIRQMRGELPAHLVTPLHFQLLLKYGYLQLLPGLPAFQLGRRGQESQGVQGLQGHPLHRPHHDHPVRREVSGLEKNIPEQTWRTCPSKPREDSNPTLPPRAEPLDLPVPLHRDTQTLTLTPAAPSLPGGPSAPGLPWTRERRCHESCPCPAPICLPTLPAGAPGLCPSIQLQLRKLPKLPSATFPWHRF